MDEAGWPKSLPQMKVIDDLLRCGICFDYFNIAMIIPQCSHNYCSLCIRKFLSYKTQCPTCRVAVVEPDLKNNRLLDDLVKNFDAARQHLLRFVLDSPPMSPSTLQSNRSSGKLYSAGASPLKKGNACMDNFLGKTKKSKRRKSEDNASEDTVVVKMEVESDTKEPSRIGVEAISSRISSTTPSPMKISTPGAKEGQKVDCPVCCVGIPQQYINRHLDSCLMSDEKKESLRSSVQKRKPMAKVVYNLLSDRDLRKKLKEVGLSSQGSKQVLTKRHQEFVHMFNAQCDSLNPKSVAEIVKEIEQNEKAKAHLLKKPGENSMTFSKDQSEQEIEGIHTDYRKKHKNEFQSLVDEVKNRWRKSGKREIIKAEEPTELPTRLEEELEQQLSKRSILEQVPRISVVNEDGENGSIVREGGANWSINEGEESTKILSDEANSSNVIEGAVKTRIENENRADQTCDTEWLNDEEGSLVVDVDLAEDPADGCPDANVTAGEEECPVDDDVTEEGANELSAKGTSFRSDSPTFPLSPYSVASSSSDILRDLEEVKSEEPSDLTKENRSARKKEDKKNEIKRRKGEGEICLGPALSWSILPVVKAGKRKSKGQRIQEGGSISTRSKRSRK